MLATTLSFNSMIVFNCSCEYLPEYTSWSRLTGGEDDGDNSDVDGDVDGDNSDGDGNNDDGGNDDDDGDDDPDDDDDDDDGEMLVLEKLLDGEDVVVFVCPGIERTK